MKSHLSVFLCGLLFAVGLGISGMTDANKVRVARVSAMRLFCIFSPALGGARGKKGGSTVGRPPPTAARTSSSRPSPAITGHVRVASLGVVAHHLGEDPDLAQPRVVVFPALNVRSDQKAREAHVP